MPEGPRLPPTQEVEIQALAVAGEILDLLAETGERTSAAEIARRLGMTPPRVWRHLNSLEALGFVDSGSSGRDFTLGGRLAQLGHLVTDRITLTEVAHEPVVELRDQLGESVYLAVPGQQGAAVAISLDSGGPISIHLALGVVFPWHASASGRVILAYSSQGRREQFLQPGTPEDLGHDPIADPEHLRERLETIRLRGFDTAETTETARASGSLVLNAIAAPVFDHTEEIAGSVGVLTGIQGDAVCVPEIKDPLFRCAARISESLGSTWWPRSSLLPEPH